MQTVCKGYQQMTKVTSIKEKVIKTFCISTRKHICRSNVEQLLFSGETPPNISRARPAISHCSHLLLKM